MKQQIKRITLSGSDFQTIEFDHSAGKYFVKNFSDGDIYVSFDENVTENEAIKIPANYYQIVIANEYFGSNNYYRSNKIYVKGTGEVEVQQLCFN